MNNKITGHSLLTATTRVKGHHRNLKRGTIALGGTAIFVLASGGTAFAGTSPLDVGGLLSGTNIDVQGNVGVGTGVTPSSPGLPTLPNLPIGSLPIGSLPTLPVLPTLPTVGNLPGTVGNVTNTVNGLLGGLEVNLDLNVPGNQGGAGGTGAGSGSTGGSNSGGSAGGSNGGGVLPGSNGDLVNLDVSDPLSVVLGQPFDADAQANVGAIHGDVTVDAAANAAADGSATTRATTGRPATVTAAEVAGSQGTSGLSWELVLIAGGALGAAGAANIFVLRRGRTA